MNKITLLFTFCVLLISNSLKAETYMFGGPKLFYYDVTNEDLQSVANDIVSLGFSSAKVSANTSGLGFDIGIGGDLTESLDFEAGFVYMGEFELKAAMTGPTENLTSTSSAYSFPVGAKLKLGDSENNIYLKGGMHYWKQVTDISTSLGKVDMWGTGLDPMFGIGGQLGNFTLHYEHYSFSGVGAGAGVGEGGISAVGLTWISKI
jgi:hypothetical protein